MGSERLWLLRLYNLRTFSANSEFFTAFIIILSPISSRILAGLQDTGGAWKSFLPLLPTGQAICHFVFSYIWLLVVARRSRKLRQSKDREGSDKRFKNLKPSTPAGSNFNPFYLSALAAGAFSMASAFIYTGVNSMDPAVFQCILITDMLLMEVFWVPETMKQRIPLRRRWVNSALVYVACVSLFLVGGVTYPLISISGILSAFTASFLLTCALLLAETAARRHHSAPLMSIIFSGSHVVFSFLHSLNVGLTPLSRCLEDCATFFFPLAFLLLLQGLRHLMLGVCLCHQGALSVVYVAVSSAALSVALESNFPFLSLSLLSVALVARYRRSEEWRSSWC